MVRFLFFIGLTLFGAAPIAAHPHVWVQAHAELVFDDANNFVAVRHVWEFDEGFSAFATQGLDANGDGVLSREELAELAKVNIESLKEFEYFTFVQVGEKDPPYGVPSDEWLEHKDGLLTLTFTLPMEKPIAPDPQKGFQDMTVEIFDATFFVDVAFANENPVRAVRLDGSESVCAAALQRRKELDPAQSLLLSQIGPEETVPDELAPQEGDLSNTIRVTCPSS